MVESARLNSSLPRFQRLIFWRAPLFDTRVDIEACACAAKLRQGAPKPPKPREIDKWDRVAMDMIRLQLAISPDHPNHLILPRIPKRDGRDGTQSNETGRSG